jgi:hypothetical protein
VLKKPATRSFLRVWVEYKPGAFKLRVATGCNLCAATPPKSPMRKVKFPGGSLIINGTHA